jgi:hypothetical protein
MEGTYPINNDAAQSSRRKVRFIAPSSHTNASLSTYIVNLAYDGRSHLFISFLSDRMRLCIDDCSLRFRIWPAYT